MTGSSGALTRSAAVTLRLTRTIFADDFESAGGWTTNPAGTDTATRGRWERAVPEQYTGGNRDPERRYAERRDRPGDAGQHRRLER